MDFNVKVADANNELKTACVGVAIERIGDRLHLRATLPPKPGSTKTTWHQQRIAIGCHSTPSGLRRAIQEARKIGALLDLKEFEWEPYLRTGTAKVETVADWIARFERDYFLKRRRDEKSETTWRYDYEKVFKVLPGEEALTIELLREAIACTKPDTRTRKRFVDVLSRLARAAGLDADFRDLRGNYSPAQVQPRDLPGDDLIATWRDLIPNPEWRLAYSLIAAYGLRPHEVFNCHFEQFPVLTVGGKTKTGQRRVYPFYPEWADWGCGDVNLPAVTGRNNTDLGQRVTHAFTRYEIPFAPYDLRHAWAIRTMMFGLADSLAAKQMGHSVKVHCEIYHRWISDLAQDRAYQALLEKGDRPHPPDRPSPNQPNQPDNPN